ncbi:MAG TPA: CapA family protein [Candidatus Paceibacterota bacterium]|nr:CapA family protein [Candidatus Paceibacterota bacterium]HRZ34664.1 CapA family protein [Candidatus Paceibacterota bacterium]
MLRNFTIVLVVSTFVVFLGLSRYFYAPIKALSHSISSNLASVAEASVQRRAEKNPVSEIRLLFVGDIMMDRNIRTVAEKKGYDFYFECAMPTFSHYDFVIGNLEGPVTNFASVSRVKTEKDPNLFKFTMSPETLSAMKNSGINIVSIANNHASDFGLEGLRQTKENILKSGLNYFGDLTDENNGILTLTKNDVTFTLIPFNEFSDAVSASKTIKNLKDFSGSDKETSADFKIIFAHWGDEYLPVSKRIRKIAHDFIDAGADLVVGTHPHILQEREEYEGKFGTGQIFYSLGNFIFDQYWSEAVKNGGAVEIVLKNNGEAESRLLPVVLNTEFQPCISE